MANSLIRQQPLTEWVELVDMLDSKSLENVAQIYMQLPLDSDAHRRRRLEYKEEVLEQLEPLQGTMAGDAQTGGVVFTPTTKGESN